MFTFSHVSHIQSTNFINHSYKIDSCAMNAVDEATLLKLAEAEILGEAKRATLRHSIAGPSGWKPVPKTNKSFLVNTLLQTISSNRILSKKHEGVKKDSKTRERKLLQIDRRAAMSDNFVYKKPSESKTSINKNSEMKCEKDEKKRTEKLRRKKKVKIKK